eukprot:2329427-Rhodomonas_salina.1
MKPQSLLAVSSAAVSTRLAARGSGMRVPRRFRDKACVLRTEADPEIAPRGFAPTRLHLAPTRLHLAPT